LISSPTPHKKEFVQWIEGAKKEETKESRKQKMIGMLKKKPHLRQFVIG
jgi:uncharacterized protein YdeI (YjbR/CyaY-like superfamily)